ncbi:MAG TPA: HAD family hydrolase [Bacteroidota bacterium]|jgi:D-glycero-D-manno-heptose 1,7-bisphosphate phosphatase
MNRIGIFLDRDGTINEEVDYLSSPLDLHLIPGAADAIREANESGFKVFIITNQSGIARGILTEERLAEIHAALVSALARQHATIDKIYYCPHHPDFGEPPFRAVCNCRKPGTGMIDAAVREFGIDISKSFVIGDRMIDVQTGNNAGAASILVLTGYGRKELELCRLNGVPVGHVAEDLPDAIHYVKQTFQQVVS